MEFKNDSTKLEVGLEKVLGLVKAAAELNLSAYIHAVDNFSRRNAHNRIHGESIVDLPEFSAKVGVPCVEWLTHLYSAAVLGRSKAWKQTRRNIEGLPCMIKHSLSPFGTGSVLGIIQYFPCSLRRQRCENTTASLQALPTGIYIFEHSRIHCHKTIPMKHLLSLLFSGAQLVKEKQKVSANEE